jgi:shikimate 5-dehydrogenase
MRPEEIKPDTGLCTILGYNAQTGYMRKYFNKILRYNGINATAIALNIKDEHFDFTMSSVGESKVDRMMLENEFQQKALHYCDTLDTCAQNEERAEFIEVKEGKIKGYCLDDEAKALFDKPEFLDDQILFIAKMMLLANRWYGAKIEVDEIPLLIGESE